MSLDDLINQLLSEKTPQRSSAVLAPSEPETGSTPGNGETSPSPGSAAPVDDAETARLRSDVQRLMLQLKVVKAENEALKASGPPAQPTAQAPVSPVEVSQVDQTAAGNFPWKRHIASVEDNIRKKETAVAESALKVLVDVSEVISVEPAARARLLSQLGTIRIDQGAHAEAEQVLTSALALLETNGASKTLPAAYCLDGLAQCNQLRENFEQGEKLRRQAVVIAEDILGAEHPEVGYFRDRLEGLRQERSIAEIGADDKTVFDKLSAEYDAAVAAGGDGKPEEAPGDSYSGFMLEKFIANGKNALTQKNVREAESFFRSALEKADSVSGTDPRKSECMRLLAQVLEANGKDNEAKELYEKALTTVFKFIGWQDIQIAYCLKGLADVHDRLNDFGLAKNYYKQAIAAYTTVLGKDDEATQALQVKYDAFVERIKSERQWKGWSQ